MTKGINKLKHTRYGQMLYNPNDLYIGRSLHVYGEYSNKEVLLFQNLIKPGSIVFDIGANIGPHTLPFAQMIGSQGVIFAFEPQRILFQMLCANMALNNIFNVFAFNAGVGASAGTLTVPFLDYRQENNFGGLSLLPHPSVPGEATSVITIDSLNIPQSHFMKIDVEGMELDVLKGATETIRRCRPILYVENDRRDHASSLIEYLLSLGYRLYWHCPPLYNPDNYETVNENVFGNIVSINMLCIPDEKISEYTTDGLVEVSGTDDDYLSDIRF